TSRSYAASVVITAYSKRLLADAVLAKFSTYVNSPSPNQLPANQLVKPITVSGGEFSFVYDLLPPVPIGCVGINSAKAVELLRLIFWIDVADADMSTVKSVQYHLSKNFQSKDISAPQISAAEKWIYSIAAYAPEVVKATVTFND